MPPGRNPAPLALAVICLVMSSVAAKVCVLGTEPDPSDSDRIKLVLPEEDPCTCTEVCLGGHNPYARPRPGGEYYIYIRHLKYIFTNGLRPLFHCTEDKKHGTSTDNPRASSPGTTKGSPKSTDKVTTDARGSTGNVGPESIAAASTAVASTQADTTPASSCTPEPIESSGDGPSSSNEEQIP